MNYNGNEPYIFISYSHSDRLSVEYILGYMIRAGIRFWYDNAIEPGDDWKKQLMNVWKTAADFFCFSQMSHITVMKLSVNSDMPQRKTLKTLPTK